MHLKRMLVLIPFAAVVVALASAPASAQKWYEKAVKKVTVEIKPAEAKPVEAKPAAE